jgi:hypothetical protein
MNNKHIVLISISLSALMLSMFGCDERTERESSLVDKATRSEAIVTATTTPTNLAPVELQVTDQAPEANQAIDELSRTEEPSTEVRAFDAELRPSGGLVIQRFVTTSSVEKREPTGAGAVFRSSDDRVYAFIEASNESSSPKTLLVHFLGPEDEVSGGIELEIPASVPRWRTWAYTRHAKAPGLWRVEIRDADGALIGALPFEIEADQ